jgi:DNA ligase (NAD+)
MREPIQVAPSRGFAALIDMGFQVAWHQQLEGVKVTDEQLSAIYTDLLKSYQYEIDGLVIQTDRAYTRESKKNPDYAKAFKEALDNDTAITVVTNVEWNISQDGYIKPTVVFNPVKIGNINISRASAHNARMVVEMGIGIGAKIEVIYWAKVNPRINLVLEPVEPSMPSIPYVWVSSGKSGEKPADIKVTDTQDDSVSRTIQVKRIHKFLVEIGAKGIGETTVEKIYDLGHQTVGDFINITDDDVAFLGPTASKKLVKSINDAMRSITFPKLMAGSKVFGRGLGTTRFTQLLKAYPDGELVTDRKSRQEYIDMFLKVNGFAQKTAELAADGMEEFWKFVDNEIPGSLYEKILDNTIGMVEEPKVSGAGAALKGKKICITGFRDRTISDFIEANGGTVQGTCNGSTNMVVRPDESYTNKKTEFAEEHNIRIITKEDFMSEYLET